MKQLNQLYHHQHHLPLLVLALIFVLPCIVRGVTITHHDKPAEAKLPAMASIMMKEEEKESLKTLNHNISLPNSERHKRLLPYMNFYLGYNFNQPIKNINNVGIEYQPKEINYPSLPITLTTTKNKDVNIEQQQKYTPFLESNALPGPFIPMVNPPSATRNNHHQVNYIPIIRQQQQVAIERPNYSQIYDKLSQLKQQQQKLHSLNSYNNGQYLIETYEHQQPKKPAQPPNYIPTSVEVVPQQIKYVNANNNHPQQAQQLPIKIYVQENYPQQQQNRPYLQPIRFVQRPKIYLQQEQVQEQVQEKPRHGEKIYLQGGHRIVLEAPVGATPVLTKTYEPKQQQPIYIIDQKVPSSNPPQQLTKLRPVITTYEEPLPQRFTQKPKLQQVFFIQKQHPQINNNKQQQQQQIIPIQHQQVSPQQPQHHQYIQMSVNNNVKQVSIQQPDLPVPAVASLQQQQQEQMPVVHPPAPVPVPMQKYETFKYHPVSLADYQKYETATEHFATTEKYAPHLQQYTTINEQDVINPGPNFKYKYPEITVQQTYAPTEKYQIQNGQPQQHHKYQTIQKFREEEEEQNTLAQILKKLQETNTLPQTFTPQNIDNSIRTLVKILSSLKKQNKFEKPIIVSENQGLEYEDEDNEAGVNLGDIPGALSAPGDTPEGGTPGKAGVDYPALSSIPQTSFNCKTQRYKGFFGDPDTNCQVWHYCDLNGGQASFLCPNGTIFSQVALTCDWWFNVKCSTTPQLYVLNERLYKYILPLTPKFPEDYSGPLVDRYLALKFKEMEDKMRKERKGATTKDPGPDEAQELINHEEKKSQKSQINNKLQQQTAEGQEDEEEDGIEVRIEAQAEDQDQDQELIQEETSTELN